MKPYSTNCNELKYFSYTNRGFETFFNNNMQEIKLRTSKTAW